MSTNLYLRLRHRFGPPQSPSRRDLLKATLAASAGLLLSNCASRQGSEFFGAPREGLHRIVIVGAGLSGLACAYELASVGYDVAILEARNRIGGRVLTFTDMVPGKTVEAGGELIGTNHPTWASYAAKFNLNVHTVSEDDSLHSPLMIGNELLPNEQAEQIYKEMDAAYATLIKAAAAVDAEQPWLTTNAAALDAYSMADWLAHLDISRLAKRAIRAQQESTQAAPLERQSFLAFLTMIKAHGLEKYFTDTENSRCAGGNQLLTAALATPLLKHIQLNAPVISIVTGNDQVMVTTATGQRFLAEDVILTTPPATWKPIHITPPLPDTLKVQSGPAVKFLSAVKRRFWTDAKLSADSLSDSDLSETWEGTAGQPGDQNAELTAFSGGPAAQHLRSRQPIDRQNFCKDDITKRYPDYPANLGSSRFINWPSDPATLTGYSFPAPRQLTTIGPIFREGLGRLHFAGEHTSPGFPGYMEGALHSGVSLARRLAERDKAHPLPT